VITTVLSVTGCKSKDSGQTQEQDNSSSITAAQAEQLREENERLKAALEQTRKQQPDLPAEHSDPDYPDRKLVDGIIERYTAAGSADEKVELLNQLGSLVFTDDRAVIALIESALADPNEQVNRAGAELLENYESPYALDTIEKALYSPDVQTRVSAVSSLANIRDPKVTELLVTALSDESVDVREEAFSAAEEQPQSVQMQMLETAIRLPYDDVKTYAVDTLEEFSNHKSVEILMQGLNDPDPAFREQANQSLNFLIEREFDSYEQAAAWWNENRYKYDSELFLKDEWLDED
jgi:HEAT repeat protein